MEVKVESPEQYYVKFNTSVDEKIVKKELKLQQYKDNKWTKIDDINIRQIDSAGKEYIVELKEDWTDILETKTSKKNYYNYNFRLHMDEKKVTNLLNGLKNAEINYNLDDDIMKNPDVTSPKLKDVTQNGDKNVKIEFSEPAQIDVSNDHQITPTEEQKRDNDGKYLLSKEDIDNDNYIFTWKYNDYVSGAETDNLKASDVQKLLDDENYNTFKFNTSKIDTTDLSKATINLTHSGTVDFGNLKVQELNINTMETGILNIKNVKADKVTVYAPYADVRLNGVKVEKNGSTAEGVGTLEVKDILAGTLTLSYGTVVDDLKVTDPNEGKIRLEGDAKVSKTFEIDTKGDITLDGDITSANSGTDGKVAAVEVKQACKIIVEYGTVKFKIADGVKGSDLEIISENGANVSFDGSTPEGFKKDQTTNTVFEKGEVSLGDGAGTDGSEGKKATATYSVTAGKVDGVVTVKIDDDKDEAKTIGPVTVKATDSSKEIAEAIAGEINKKEGIGYTASSEDNKVIITASTSGKKDKFDVTFDFKSDKQQNKETVIAKATELANNVSSIGASETAAKKINHLLCGWLK